MAAVRHLEFSKIATFVTWRVSEHGSTCTYQISCQSDNNSCRCSQKTIFNTAAVRHFECHIFYKSACDQSWNQNFESAHQISSKSDDSRLIYSDKTIFKMAAVRILNFRNLVCWSCDLCVRT